MAEFIRARSIEEKKQRMNEIMKATDHLFREHTYHEITLTTIADALNWSRGNLYKYVATKEEIFLELYLEKQDNYFSNITSAFADKEQLSNEEFTVLWTGILDKNHDYLKYYGILTTIIETHVTLERLVEFKKKVSSGFDLVLQIISKHCDISTDRATVLYETLLFHACGLNNSCNINPLVDQAMKMAGLPKLQNSFVRDFCDFMLMCLRNFG
ncbi:MAG: TetR family transcriptional regulator [Sporolactobacillus sp.]